MSTVAWHRGLTLGTIVGLAATNVAYSAVAGGEGRRRAIYRGLLATTMGILTVGAHFGGTLSRGGDYLTRYAPAPVRKLLGVPDADRHQLAEWVDYTFDFRGRNAFGTMAIATVIAGSPLLALLNRFSA